MKGLIFSEGNGYGHAARGRLLSRHFNFPIMTFGKGAEYCRKNGMDFIEIPSPYRILSEKGNVKIATDYSGLIELFQPDVLSQIRERFSHVDAVIVDGSPLGLAAAMLYRKRTIFITNDISAMVGVQGAMRKSAARSLLMSLLKFPKAIIVPDFPPPLAVCMQNLETTLPLSFCGPLAERVEQKRHRKKYAVAGPVEKLVRPFLGESAIYASDVQDIRAYFQDAKLVISHGGHTTIMEALSHGKPLLCIVDGAYPERINNALQLEKNNVGMMLEKRFLSAESLSASIEYSKTLDKARLEIYRRYAQKPEPLKTIEKFLQG